MKAQPATAFEVPSRDVPVLIAGGGPSGSRAAQELSQRGVPVVLLNAERWQPYNRVKLTPLLSGEAQLGQVYVPEATWRTGKVERFDGVSLVDIDIEGRRALTSTGRVIHYSDLVLALGSRAHMPNIPGRDLPGVYVFRNFDDVEALRARSMSARRVVVIGGGLLGLEAARGMSALGAEVTIVEHEARLMPRQLDDEGAAMLAKRIEALGVQHRTGVAIRAIEGDGLVDGVSLADGTSLACDTVIVCTGVRANIQIAAALGLKHGRGITVDDQMQTSAPNIYAVGECAEHAGVVCGLVGPCYDQVAVAVAAICGDDAAYTGSTPATKLKVLGADVFSVGAFESVSQMPGARSYTYRDDAESLYRRIFVRNGRLLGAIGVGEWPEVSQVQRAVGEAARVYPWQLWRFERGGALWGEGEDSVATWPRDAIVCNCTGVKKGAIQDAITLGAGSIDEIRAATSANSVCGTCKVHLQDLLGEGAQPEAARWWRSLLILSGVAALAALATLLLPRIPFRDTFVVGDIFNQLWLDSQMKQISGYTLLGISAVAALISLRKRIFWLRRLGGYDWWRIGHLVLGLAAALGLVWHTGLRLGSNLNMLLMLSFLLTLVTGAVAGLITGGEHELRERRLATGKNPRAVPLWLHVIGVWPLPILLIFHILSVYMY
ncbi:MAG: FAD-dependent oxidoreductase [Pseudomonadota bacterium]